MLARENQVLRIEVNATKRMHCRICYQSILGSIEKRGGGGVGQINQDAPLKKLGGGGKSTRDLFGNVLKLV